MLKPRAVRSGDRVAVIAPASAFDRAEFDEGIEELTRLGFEPVYDESIFARQRYLAGAAELRAAALRRAWTDPHIAAIVAVRGGYGSAQLLPLLEPAEARAGCKPLVGYSDVTALLTFLTVHCEMVAFHGPMLAGRLGRGEEGYDRRSFEAALCVPAPLGELTGPGVECVRAGETTGLLFGGTITQLLASLGTAFAFRPPDGCILFLEEVGERPYRLDRMVTQLRQSGILAAARGIVIGELPRCDEPSGEPAAREVMAELFADFPGPVLIGFPSGHTTGPALTLPLGVSARLIAGPRPRLAIEEAAVQ
jgi:muramoyltetrapeptide carboxypeptidase